MGTEPLHPPSTPFHFPFTSLPHFTVKFFQFLRYFDKVLPLHPSLPSPLNHPSTDHSTCNLSLIDILLRKIFKILLKI